MPTLAPWFFVILLALGVYGCVSGGNALSAYCQNVYLDQTCIKLRKEEEKRRAKEMVKVCDQVIGSRISRAPENCKEVSREAVRRAMQTGGRQ